MKRLTRDNNGFMTAILANPFMMLLLIIGLVILAIVGGLFVIYSPHIAAAAVLMVIAVLVVWKVPIADIRVRLGVFAALGIAALCIYFWGDSILSVVF